MRRIVAFDCDDVLVGFTRSAINALRDVTGITGVHPRDFESNEDICYRFGLQAEEFRQLLREKEVLERCELEPHAEELLRAIRHAGDDSLLVTARAWHPDAEEITRAFFLSHGAELDDYLFVHYGESKLDALKGHLGHDIERMVFMVEDNPKHVEHLYDEHCQNVLMSKPWNLLHRHELVRQRKVHHVCADLYEMKRVYLHEHALRRRQSIAEPTVA